MRLEDYILGLPSPRLPARKLDTVITMLMLLPSGNDKGRGHDGLRTGRYRLDTQLITSLLDSTRDSQVQWIIVRSDAYQYLPPPVFRRLYYRFWPSRNTVEWRWLHAHVLGVFLRSNPGEARHYLRPIWALAADENENVALRGLDCVRLLGDALTVSGARRLVSLSSHPSDLATQALSVLNDLYRGIRKLTPEVRAYLLDDAIISTLRKAPRDEGGEDSAYAYCMTGIRMALARSGRKLRVVK
jgi:hypothetical protein